MNTTARLRAFTLIEVLVTLAIIGLLVGLLVTNTDRIFGQSEEVAARIFAQESVRVPLMAYRRDVGDYPTTAEGLQALITAPSSRTDRWRGPYLDIPGGKLPADPWGRPYQYRYPATKNKSGYDVYSLGRDGQPDTADDIGNW